MPGSIFPLPVVLQEDDQKAYDALKAPKSIVVRYGYLKMVGEFPYDGDAKPGCGSKLVVRTPRGIELGEMLTTTCGNGGCGKNITRKQMLEYIDNSGGRDYPFTNQGKVVRVATIDDLNEQSKLDAEKPTIIKAAKQHILDLNLQMKLVDVEILLTRERILFHYTSEDWVDFRELVRILAGEFHSRIEMHQVSARDEARIVADYEKCGQHCCCKQFLKVLKPISMRSAKVQKATLDPTKISGRCGRLMCCLRYEDETYEDLRKRLPHRKSRVITPDGFGTVIDSQILTQLALVAMDDGSGTAAYPVENLQPLPKDQDPGAPAPREPFVPRGKGGPGAPPAGPGPGGPGEPQNRQSGGPQDRGPRPDRGPDRNQNRGPDRDQPRRPMPGEPLNEDEIESKEGLAPDMDMSDRPQERSQDRPQGRPQNRGQDRGQDRGPRPDRGSDRNPDRDQPRRPMPGNPLGEGEIESKEGNGPGMGDRSQERPQGQGRPQGRGQERGQDRGPDRGPDRSQEQGQNRSPQRSQPSGEPKPYKPFRSLRNQPPGAGGNADGNVPGNINDAMNQQDPGDNIPQDPMDNEPDDSGPEIPGQSDGNGPQNPGQPGGGRRRRRRGRGGRGGGGGGAQGGPGGQPGPDAPQGPPTA